MDISRERASKGVCAWVDPEGNRRKWMDWEEKTCARRYMTQTSTRILRLSLSAQDQQLSNPMVALSLRTAAHRTSPKGGRLIP